MSLRKKAVLAIALIGVPGLAAADPIATFKQLCLPYLGNPEGSQAAATKLGFEFIPFGDHGTFGSRAGSDETLQLNVATSHSYECAVTTDEMDSPEALSAKFFGEFGLTPVGNRANGKVNGVTYTFMHNTYGGEAFVVYKVDGAQS